MPSVEAWIRPYEKRLRDRACGRRGEGDQI